MDDQEHLSSPLERCLQRSQELEAALVDILLDDGQYVQWDDSARTTSSCLAAELALEHWSAVSALMATDHRRSATALVRLEYEAIVRSAWLLHAATDDEVATMHQALTTESEKRAGELPFFGLMLKALETSAPARLYEDLQHIKVNMSKSLNSFVHSGIHALQRGEHGYPVLLALQVIQTANALGTMAAMMLANLTGDPQKGRRINEVIPAFRDCLPPLRPIIAAG
jgi:hypothetical protein